MEYRIEMLDEFKMVGYVKQTTNALMKGMRDAPAFWKQIIKENKNEQLSGLITKPPFGLLGACVYNVDEKDARKFDYYIAAATDMETPDGMEAYVVPAMTWAIFPCTMKTIGKTQVNIVKKWAPKAAYELLNTGYETGKMKAAAPDLEVYADSDSVEIWVAVKPRN